MYTLFKKCDIILIDNISLNCFLPLQILFRVYSEDLILTRHFLGKSTFPAIESAGMDQCLCSLRAVLSFLSVYCPAGCKNVTGDVSGNSEQGYRDVSTPRFIRWRCIMIFDSILYLFKI